MIITPMVRNNICLNSHPQGCAEAVKRHIAYIRQTLAAGEGPSALQKDQGGIPKLVLVIGCSTGYGLASRIAAGFGYGAATLGISLEKPPSASKPGTPGYYHNHTFDREAVKAGLIAKTLDGDAYSDELKGATVEAIRASAAAAGIPPKLDLIIYSLASPVRRDPADGVLYRSVIKPIGQAYAGKTVDMMSGKITPARVEPATETEIAHTIKVMGGEDWERWIHTLAKAQVLSPAVRTVAYTYIGPEFSWPIYKNGTIGRAKEDLERACRAINRSFVAAGQLKARSWVSVNKALVTRASAVIPVIPLYVSCLFKVMKARGLHESCIAQIARLYRERLYTAEAREDPRQVPVDPQGRIRMDDWEMQEAVQHETHRLMEEVTEENIRAITDVAGFRHDFLEAHGFEVAGVDYAADVPSCILSS
ncbi:MAG: trans-2-enoyl-CoA reductase family protein [Treponema sp.]|jgi:enoyl-[acyl-carrier protein] reductase/trans-2-enoyl-CoA reductase (NAD+)|nr:trans-2-enoyl-CoA reductase family protein [Treponema sp.]